MSLISNIALAHRNHPAWWAFLIHRLSGLALALFIPLHFLLLGLAIDAATLDSVLDWTRTPLVRFSELGIVTALATHLICGVRLLVVEFWLW